MGILQSTGKLLNDPSRFATLVVALASEVLLQVDGSVKSYDYIIVGGGKQSFPIYFTVCFGVSLYSFRYRWLRTSLTTFRESKRYGASHRGWTGVSLHLHRYRHGPDIFPEQGTRETF